MVLSFTSIFFIIISSDTKDLKPEYAERMDYLHDMLLKYVAPAIAFTAWCLLNAVIVWGV